MRRLPIRLRLTVAFALAMAVVLAGLGVFLYVQLRSSLDESIDEGLQARAEELSPVATTVAAGGPAFRLAAAEPDERVAQVLAASGRVLAATPRVDDFPLLDRAALARVAQRSARLERADIPGIGGSVRLLAQPVAAPSGKRVLVVGTSLEDRNETLRRFLAVLLVAGPAALLLTSALGYALATAALRPVESMRAEAATISASEPGRRLTLPQQPDEIGRLAETLNRMLDRLEAALERERTFVADASHELRTPLALLTTELDLALRRPRSHAELEQALRSAAAEVDRLTRLAEDLLLLARSDRGQVELRRTRLDAADILTQVADRFALRAETEGRTIEVHGAAGLGMHADELRLQQGLGNLLENALRHGGGTIELFAVERDGRIELHVLDEGPGFPPDFLPHAFDRFRRADDARLGTGTGLGLTIARVIATTHGGSAYVANRAHGGADAWISIPTS